MTEMPAEWSNTFAFYKPHLYPVVITYFDSHSKEVLHRQFLDGPASVKAPAIRTLEHTFITCRVLFRDGRYEDLTTGPPSE
jgi:hypothetical protein